MLLLLKMKTLPLYSVQYHNYSRNHVSRDYIHYDWLA
jgi:hypothetical protein